MSFLIPLNDLLCISPFLQALDQTQLERQLENGCVDFGPMSEVIPGDVGANQAGVQRNTQPTTQSASFNPLFFLPPVSSSFSLFSFLSTLTWRVVPLVQVVRLLVTRTVRGAVMPVDK